MSAPSSGGSAERARRPHAALTMWSDLPAQLFGADVAGRLGGTVDVLGSITDGDITTAGDWVADVELLIAGWGAPCLDARALDRMPKLRGVVYTAGSVRGVMTDEAYARGIRISSAAATNALPVAEFTLVSILFAGKRVLEISSEYRRTRDFRPPSTQVRTDRWGNFGLRVGIISASKIGRRVIELLRPFDVEVLLWDPTLTDDIPGATRMPLDELLATSDVVSIHAPTLPETVGLIGRRELSLMRDGATLINTARGILIDQDALVAELHNHRLHAILDVTNPDQLPANHPLFDAPNVLLTPHIAGSQGNELRRLGDAALDEVRRFARDVPFVHDVSEPAFVRLA